MASTASPGRARILIVEDEPQLRSLLRLYLEREWYEVIEAGDGRAALASFEAAQPDLVVLDLMLPGLQGEAVMTALRAVSSVPILVASAKRSDAERIAGLRLGADDYLGKPFNPHELLARVEAILRRAGHSKIVEDSVLSLSGGRLVVDPLTRRYSLSGEGAGRLTPGEFRLLQTLARRPGAPFTRPQLLESIARRPDDVYDRLVDAHVANLRRKLRDDSDAP